MTTAYLTGRSDALRGLKPCSRDYDYLRGWQAGHSRRNRGSRTNVSSQVRLADESMNANWGVRRYARCKRCPKCGTPNMLRRPVTDVCLGCSMKEASP
jgi:hypothetical protein